MIVNLVFMRTGVLGSNYEDSTSSSYAANCTDIVGCFIPGGLGNARLFTDFFGVSHVSEVPLVGAIVTPTYSGVQRIVFTLASCLFVIGLVYFFFVMVKTIILGINFWKSDNTEDYELAKKKFVELGKAFILPLISILVILFFLTH